MIPKFKAFLKDTKQIVDVKSIFFENEVIKTENNDFYLFDDIILMQSTGVYDNDGVEIFEGDIVETIYDGKLFTGVIVYDQEETDFKATNGCKEYGNNFCYLGGNDSNEVIGNVHENPKLIEVSYD